VLALGAGLAVACGPWLAFRAYLRRSFWTPVRYMTSSLAATAPRGGSTVSYAGFANDVVPLPLKNLRDAYQGIATGHAGDRYAADIASARRAANETLGAGLLSGQALDEARLLDAKVAVREADVDSLRIDGARQKLEAFLASRPSAAAESEARCWLARILNTQGDAVGAARIYLDELDRPSPVVPAAVLATSLRAVFVAHRDQFLDRAEAFFDNPRHALFIVNVLTNPDGTWEDPTTPSSTGWWRAPTTWPASPPGRRRRSRG
jgi:hypothetical protein